MMRTPLCQPEDLPLHCLAMLLAVACLPVFAQTTPSAAPHAATSASGLYRIAGTVVNAVTAEPVRHAAVAALSEGDSHTVASVESDNEGRFMLEGLSAAKYQLTASKRGFRTAYYDEHEEFSTAIVTGAGQETEGLTFRLTPGASLHGVVAAEGGDPVEGAKVMLFLKRRGHEPSERITPADTTSTDDTGAYDFSNLAAGEYLLAVKAEPWYALHHEANRSRSFSIDGVTEMNAALDVAYPVTFFDATTEEASATSIVLAGGSREVADFNLHAVPALHLTIETPRKPNGSIARAELRQTIFGNQVSAESAGFLDAMRTGTTEFNGVAPGHYELMQGDPPRIADLDASTSQQVDPALGTPTVAVSGTLRTVSGAPLTYDATLTLNWLSGTNRQAPMQAVSHNGSFAFVATASGEWELSAESGAGGTALTLAIVSTIVGGRTHPGNLVTVRDRPLSIMVALSEGTTRVEGFARKSGAPSDGSSSLGWKDGKGVAGVMVVLVPKDLTALHGMARRDQSDSDGSFALHDVVPGQYTVVAVQDGWDLDWAQPEVIGRYLPGGIPVTVTGNSGKLLSLAGPVPVQPR